MNDTVKTFYVYEHIRPDTGEVFYVGKGCGRRARRFSRKSNPHHCRIVAKLSVMGLEPEVRVIHDNLTEAASLMIEKQVIATHRSLGRKIVNLTDGGEGSSGYRFSDEQRENCRRALNDPAVKAKMCKPRSEIGRANIKAALNTLEAKANLSKAQLEAQNRPEVKAKLVEAALSRWSDPAFRERMTDSIRASFLRPEVAAKREANHKNPETIKRLQTEWIGRTHTAESKEKSRQSNLGQVRTEETKAKMRKPRSEEGKANMRIAAQLREAKKRELSKVGDTKCQ